MNSEEAIGVIQIRDDGDLFQSVSEDERSGKTEDIY